MTQLPGTAEPYVFLSYTSTDRARVLALADVLEAAGIRVWVDRRNIVGASSWDVSIVDAIRDCTVFALTCSARSLGSPNVQQEVRLAWEEQRPILPLLLEPVVMPRELRYPLAGRQWVELLDRPEEAWLPDVLQALAGQGLIPRPPAAAPARLQPGAASPPPEPAAVHLPTPLTSFIGREQELAEITALLGTTRMLTLTGPGGTGKTRLAIAAARQVAASFPDGVWFVDLAGISDPAGVVPTIAQVLGVREREGRSLAETLAAALRRQRLLLVLDNFEQVVAAALQVYDLLVEAPELFVLVSSRVLLRVGGERAYAVPPLPLPDPARAGSPAALAENPAVALFVARAHDVRADFALTPDTAPVVAAICARLDGLPLAIELAAPRVRVLAPADLLRRLEQRLPLLTGGARSAPARQQTLRDTIAWSYLLLEPQEQPLFRRLGVFVGGFTLEAVEAVCAGECDRGVDVLDELTSLVEKSLVQQHDVAGELRFHMLETIREFAAEQLSLSGEADSVQEQHAAYFAALAETLEPQLWQRGQLVVLHRLQREQPNVRAALTWAVERGEHDPQAAALGLRLFAALFVWYYRTALAEGQRWGTRLVALPAAASRTTVRARALYHAGFLVMGRASPDERQAARPLLEESVAIWRELGEKRGLGLALCSLGRFPEVGQPAAQKLLEEGVALLREVGTAVEIAQALNSLGIGARLRGDLATAAAAFSEALTIRRRLGVPVPLANTLMNLGTVAAQQRNLERGVSLYAEGIAVLRTTDESWPLVSGLLGLGHLTCEQGELQQAASLFHEAIGLAQQHGIAADVGGALDGLALVASRHGAFTHAARLWGALEAARDTFGDQAGYHHVFHPSFQQTVTTTRAMLGDEAFAAAWVEGAALTPEATIAEALAIAAAVSTLPTEPALPANPAARAPFPDGLTTREVEVLRLIATGQSTREIAAALVISEATVTRHVTNLYGKIGARGRADATAYAFRHGLAASADASSG